MVKQIAFMLVTVAVFITAFVLIERTFSPNFQQCIATHTDNKNDGTAKKNLSPLGTTVTSYVQCSGDFLAENGEAITALATIIIAAFTCTLWVATSRQAKLTREAFVADKRAFVFASGINALYEHDTNSGQFNWRMSTVWQNSGDTPTRGLQFYTDCFLSNSRMQPTYDFTYTDPAVPPGSGMLGPKMASTAGQAPHFPQAAITPQDIVDIQHGNKFLYLWGWARYFDTLPDTPRRITRFCWQIIISGDPVTFDPRVDPQSVRFFNVYQPRGNCADEECALQGLG